MIFERKRNKIKRK